MHKITSLTDLPIEIIEQIVAKCHENDLELLVDDFKTVVERDDPAYQTDRKAADDTGWETEEDEEDIDADEDEDDLIIDDFGDEVIASHFCDTCENFHRVGKRFCSGPDGTAKGFMIQPSLHQLALTNKLLRKLALPYIFQGVDFEAIPNQTVSRYLELIAPKYGHLVKELWIRISPGENSEFFHIGQGAASDPVLYEPERRFELARDILQALPNLMSVDLDYTHLEHGRFDDLFDDLRERGPKLSGLHLAADTMTCRFTARQLCPLLASLTNLVELEISGVDQQSAGEPSLRDAIASLSKLEVLDIADAHCVQNNWAEANWQCKLKAIELDDCQNISGQGVEALIQCHATSLRHLALNGTPYQDIGDFTTGDPLDLPKLVNLSLDDYQFDFNLLKRFQLCPALARLELGSLDDMDPKQLTDLIESNGFPALKEVWLSCDWPTSAENVAMDSLELICFEKGITLEHESPDSDDEDDDISFDEGDEGNEYWEEGLSEDEEDGVETDEDDELSGEELDDVY